MTRGGRKGRRGGREGGREGERERERERVREREMTDGNRSKGIQRRRLGTLRKTSTNTD